MKTVRFLMLLACACTLWACDYNNEEDLYANSTCDTDNVTYAASIAPLMQGNCISCHSNANRSGNISLEGYDNVKIQVNNGKLYGSVSHASGFSPMPQGGKLSNCNIAKIKAWIDAGALNN